MLAKYAKIEKVNSVCRFIDFRAIFMKMKV